MAKKNLYKLWKHSPFSWAIIRTPECYLLSQEEYKSPILEVGCGDGFVSQVIFSDKKNVIDLGIDIDPMELKRAKKATVYKKNLLEDITHNKLKSNSFNTVFANGVLEHIPDLEKALAEIARILKPGGKLITTSPTNNYTRLLFYYRLFNKIGLHNLANWYGERINKVFAHKHLLSYKQWETLLKKVHLTPVKHIYYNNSISTALHDLFLPFSIFTKLIKKHTDKMVLFPFLRGILITPFVKQLEEISLYEVFKDKNASILLVAHKKHD